MSTTTFSVLRNRLPKQDLSWLGYLLFWGAMFLLNAGPHWEKYKTSRELLETAGMLTSLQAITAVVAVRYLVPKFLNQDKKWAFAISLFLVVFAVSQLNILARVLYLEPTYPDSYSVFLRNFGEMTLLERLNPLWTTRYILFSKVPLFVSPTILIIAYQFHTKQQQGLRWLEQKRSAELEALRNQLNPHFIFNTLNNIYALSLKKSDQTPLAIEKLSNILDYVVYRCNEKYVPLDDEITLIDNYLGLEKLRYGDRLKVITTNNVSVQTKIAPLILLTLLENACKHSARNELGQATIRIDISATDKNILISIVNSKPHASGADEAAQLKVGLENLRKQLELLYPAEHQLQIIDESKQYSVNLSLAQR